MDSPLMQFKGEPYIVVGLFVEFDENPAIFSGGQPCSDLDSACKLADDEMHELVNNPDPEFGHALDDLHVFVVYDRAGNIVYVSTSELAAAAQ